MYDYSINDVDWHSWLYQQLPLASQQHILEAGCGTGILWKKNVDKLPDDITIILTDQSEGMLNTTRKNLSEYPQFDFRVMRIEELQFADDSFELVTANHMLYHIPNLEKALWEVGRVLKPSGTFIAATNSQDHLKELKEALLEFEPKCEFPRGSPLKFVLENGQEALGAVFSQIEVRTFTNTMQIPTPQPILQFLLSMFDGVKYPDLRPRLSELEQHIMSKMENGVFTVTGCSGIFVCHH
jgi:SAM-dependent methyltransferase